MDVICEVVCVFVYRLGRLVYGMQKKRIFLEQEWAGGLGENVLSRKILMQLSIREVR